MESFLCDRLFFLKEYLQIQKKAVSLHRNSENHAQMAESVDALVSNTSGFTSIPVRPRVWVLRISDNRKVVRDFFFYTVYSFLTAKSYDQKTSDKHCLFLDRRQYARLCAKNAHRLCQSDYWCFYLGVGW